MSSLKLSDKYDVRIEDEIISLNIDNIPSSIKENINPNFELREYQINAISRFIYYIEKDKNKDFPIQLLFNMATGSGKTLIMVMSILYLYEKGYRNFVFFVDKTNIIKKTIENFLNKNSSKYLFNQRVFMDGQEVLIKQVDNFSSSSDDSINIYFSTISGLHSRLRNPKENSVTFEDFRKEKTVFLSDEAHHINAETKKKKNQSEELDHISWESTVRNLVNSHNENILLEFTATIDWDNEFIFNKYKSRVLFEYDLKRYRLDKYSKDVFLLQSDSEIKDRIFQTIIISQYRRRIAADHKIFLKPVILMKSKYTNVGKKQIAEGVNTSSQNMQLFNDIIKNLKMSDINKNKTIAKNIKDDSNILKKAFLYFENDLGSLIEEIKIEFSSDKLVDVSDDKKIDSNQILINSLEDITNEIRVVFAVDKLNEGWDVLNLFDIIRLYGTRDTGNATIAEAQLVGRGARYFPFIYENDDSKYKRKFDLMENHPLRVIEQLHFHSIQNHRYINELKSALIDSGIHKKDGREINLIVKDSFKQSKLYKNGYIWKNKKIKNKREKVSSLSDYDIPSLFKIDIALSGSVSITNAFHSTISNETIVKNNVKNYTINRLPINTIRRALDKFPFYYFNNLKKYFPNISSLDEFITDNKYLGGITLEIKYSTKDLSIPDLFPKLLPLFDTIKNSIKANTSEYIGSRDFVSVEIKNVVKDKTMYIEKPSASSTKEYGLSMSSESNKVLLDLSQPDCSFYVYNDDYGTDEEKYLVKMIYDNISKFNSKFKDVYLIRNQKILDIYNFIDGVDAGKKFEPDYILFLGDANKKLRYYQLFVEPKGQHIENKDKWKESFLLEIGKDKDIVNLYENDKYLIFGLPFYQESNKLNFQNKLNEIADIEF